MRSATGTHAVLPAFHTTPRPSPPRAEPFVVAASAIATALPPSTRDHVRGDVTRFVRFVTWAGFDRPSASGVMAYIVARCSPPLDVKMPDWFPAPVAPVTVVREIDGLRRVARLRHSTMEPWLQSLEAREVLHLQRACGGRVAHTRSVKQPFLYADAERAWHWWVGADPGRASMVGLRDATMLLTGLVFGARPSEIVALRCRDVFLADDLVRVSFAARKTRRSLLGSHSPETVAASHPLLLRALRAWTSRLRAAGGSAETPLFPQLAANSPPLSVPLSIATLTKIVQRVAPMCTGHSLRVGMATETLSAGADPLAVRRLGGWRSDTALYYAAPNDSATVEASLRIGTTSLRRVPPLDGASGGITVRGDANKARRPSRSR